MSELPQPTIEQVQALDGRMFAMLSTSELDIFYFYLNQGRKFGVAVALIHNVDPEELARAASQRQAEKIVRRTSAKVSVTVKNR